MAIAETLTPTTALQITDPQTCNLPAAAAIHLHTQPQTKPLTPDEQFAIITRGLEAYNGADNIKAILNEEGRTLKGVWITAPTGRPHLGYSIPMIKLADFLQAGVNVTICLADIYAFLVNYVHQRPQILQRAVVYRHTLSALLRSIGAPVDRIRFVTESELHLNPRAYLDHLRLLTLVSQGAAKATGPEVGNTTMLSPLLTPSVQALDEEYCDADFDFGGIDQDGLFSFAETLLPKLGYRARSHLMNPMLPGLNNPKMSASIPTSKIDLLDDAAAIRRKLSAVGPSPTADNGVLALARLVLMPISRLRWGVQTGARGTEGWDRTKLPFCARGAPRGTLLSVGDVHFAGYEELEGALARGGVAWSAVVEAVCAGVVQLVEGVKEAWEMETEERGGSGEWRRSEAVAYPDGE